MQQDVFKRDLDNHRQVDPLTTCLFLLIGLSLIIRFACLGLSDLLVEEAYYWNYANHIDWSYLDHPPMVALLIKASTALFGISEWGVRIPSLLCWGIATFFSYQLTQLICQKGLYAVFLLSILPFFFLQSWVMTPDQPLLAAWSCALYCLYRACVLNEARYWFYAGVALGLGMLSKYTIVLLGASTLCYLCLLPHARFWFFRTAPYFTVVIALVIFLPVIYWNAIHDWISFTFQSARRFNESFYFSTHELLGLLVFFLTPIGVLGFISLFKKKSAAHDSLDIKTKRFLQIFTLTPLIFFGVFSVMHPVKFNWIGPGILSIIPWLAQEFKRHKKMWLITAVILLLGYSGMMFVIAEGQPIWVHRLFLSKFIAWKDLSRHVSNISARVEEETHHSPLIVPLDKYNIGSELAFYQAKASALHETSHYYPISGSHVFGGESLMYRYWSASIPYGKTLILISDNPLHFNNPAIFAKTQLKTPVQSFIAHSQGSRHAVRPYYYQVVQMNSDF